METIRWDSRFKDLAHEEATLSAVRRERLKEFRSKSESRPYSPRTYYSKMGSARILRDALQL